MWLLAAVSYGTVLDSDTGWGGKWWIMTPDYQTLAAWSGREGREMGKHIRTLERDSCQNKGLWEHGKESMTFPWGGKHQGNFDEEPIFESWWMSWVYSTHQKWTEIGRNFQQWWNVYKFIVPWESGRLWILCNSGRHIYIDKDTDRYGDININVDMHTHICV